MPATVCHFHVPDDGMFSLENVSKGRIAYWIPNREHFYTSHCRGFLCPGEEVTVHTRRRPGLEEKKQIEIQWSRVSDQELDLIAPFAPNDQDTIKNLLELITSVVESTEPYHWGWVLGDTKIVTSNRSTQFNPKNAKQLRRCETMTPVNRNESKRDPKRVLYRSYTVEKGRFYIE